MRFHEKRRQQFLTEETYRTVLPELQETIEYFSKKPIGNGRNEEERWLGAFHLVANHRFDYFLLQYTAGEGIDKCPSELEQVIKAYEQYVEKLRTYEKDPNASAFLLGSADDYCTLIQLTGLCYLLHRQDMLKRVAALQDGENKENGGMDALFEEFLIPALGEESRYSTDHQCSLKPYEHLFSAFMAKTKDDALKEITHFLKRWYKDLSGTAWHNSHQEENQAGYYGYWSFEAAAAVLLLGIEDDSTLHSFLYYPKDLVNWARVHAKL